MIYIATFPLMSKKKIDYTKKFFESLQSNLKDIKVIFTTRINKQNLLTAITNALTTQEKDKQ